MRRGARRACQMGMAGLLLVVAAAPAAMADTVPYDPAQTLIPLGSATADDTGFVLVDLTLPDEVTEPYEVILAGLAAEPPNEDVPYSVIADVSDAVGGDTQVVSLGAEAAGWSEGEMAGALLPAVVGDPTISASASGFRPNSEVQVSVRFFPAAPPGEEPPAEQTGGTALPTTGSDIASTVVIGFLAVVVGAALVALALGRRRRHQSA